MTTDLYYLTLTALLCVLLWLPYIAGSVGLLGMLTPDDYQKAGYPKKDHAPGWLERANRTHVNLVENLPSFASLVLVAHITGEADSATALAAMIFFWSRVAHAIVYLTGLPYLRTLTFAVSVTCQVVIGYQILT